MKVIFLDVDGVLNSVDSAVAFHYLNSTLKNTMKRRTEEHLDFVSIGLLKALCDKTGAKIVVSSVWRIGRDKADFIDIFAAYGWIDFPYLDKTITGHPSGDSRRGREIEHWLDAHPDVTEYIILDDDSDMLDTQLDRFIHVSNVNGFRSKHYCKALRLLGCPDERLENQVNFVRKTTKGEV